MLDELTLGSKFHPVPDELSAAPSSAIEGVPFLPGKLYYSIFKERPGRGLDARIALRAHRAVRGLAQRQLALRRGACTP